MSIKYYGELPSSRDIYSIEDVPLETRRILYLASMTEAARRGAVLSDDDTFEWLDKLSGDKVIVSSDDETGEITGMIAYDESPRRLWVSYLAVMPTERGGGVGKALIAALKCQAGDTPITGEATPTSETYYEHLGFNVDDDRTVTA